MIVEAQMKPPNVNYLPFLCALCPDEIRDNYGNIEKSILPPTYR